MPTYRVRGPDGTIHTIQGPAGASQDEIIAAAQRLVGERAAVTPTPTPAPAQPQEEEEGILSTLGRAVQRSVPDRLSSFARVVEEAPETLASSLGMIPGTFVSGNPAVQRFAELLGRSAMESETYRDLTAPMVQGARESAAQQLEEIGPRQFGGFFEEEGFGRRLGSLAETVAESALPVAAGVTAGLLTRSPVVAGTVMGVGTAPATYAGIRERQEAEGIRDIQRAVAGTVASSALDILTGVGGKVLSGTAAAAAREILEGGLRQAAIRVVRSGGEEAGTEMLQNVIEQVAGGTNPATKQAMLETLESGLAGALGGTVFTGASEVATAPFRSREGAAPGEAAPPPGSEEAARNAPVDQEYMRLVADEVTAALAADPALTQRKALERVLRDAGNIYQRAVNNIEGVAAGEGTPTGPGVDVVGGGERGAAPAGEPAPSAPVTTELGEDVGGGLGRAVSGVPVPDVGAAAGESALSATGFDPITLPIYEAPNMAARRVAAKPIIGSIIDANYGDLTVPAGVTDQIATQMAQRAARKEVFNPAEIVQSVLVEKGLAPAVTPEVVTPSSTGLAEMGGGMAGAVGKSLRAALLAKVEAGEVSEAGGQPSPILQVAKRIKDAGIPVDVPMLERISMAVDDARGTGNFQAAVRAFVADTVQRAQPAPTAVEAELAARDQEVSQELVAPPEAVAPTVAETATVEKVTPPAPTPQQIVDNLQQFAFEEARDRGLDRGMFNEGAQDVQRGRELLTDEQILEAQGPEYLEAYKTGIQWAQDRIADAQAAPEVVAPEVVAPEVVAPEVVAPEMVAPEMAAPEVAAPEGVAPEVAAPEGVAPEQVFEDIGETPTPSDLVSTPSSSDIFFALTEELPEAERVNVRARLDRIMANYAKDGSVDHLLGALEALRGDVERRIDRDRAKRARDRVRGYERAMEVIYRAERTGQLTPESAGLLRWLLEQNPTIAEELAISIREGAGQRAAGQYSPAARLATIFTSRANEGTAVHEVLHHTERLMPERVRNGIRAAWAQRIQSLIQLAEQTNNTNMREVLGNIVQAYYGNAKAQKALKESFESGDIPYSVYHLSNPSEFWAVNATTLIGKRAGRTGWRGAARNWFEGLIEKVKDLFGFSNDTAIIAGLKAVLEAESGVIRGEMLANQTRAFADIGKTVPGAPKPRKPVKFTQKQIELAFAKADAQRNKLNRIQKRIASTNNIDELTKESINLAKLVRGSKKNIALLRGALDAFNTGKWRAILPALATGDIFRILKGRTPGLNVADDLIRKAMRKFTTTEYLTLAKELETAAKFFKKFPKAVRVFADIQFATVANQVDPSLAPNAETYVAKVDKESKELRDKLAATQDPKEKKSIQTALKKRFNEVESVYKGAPNAKDPVYGYNALSRPEFGGNKGRAIFAMIRDAHRNDFMRTYQAHQQHIRETQDPDKVDEALEKLATAFKSALDQVIYFPLMRYGNYYARVGTGETSVFKMFENEVRLNQFKRLMKAAGTPVTEFGDVADLREGFAVSSDAPIKAALKLFEQPGETVANLRNQVFDIWLQTMSSGDMRKHMAPRSLRAGYSTDILKNYANFRTSSINNLKRAKYTHKLRMGIEQAEDSIKGMPDQSKWEVFIKEVKLRAMAELSPPARDDSQLDKFITLGNRAAFYQYLAQPMVGAVQLTQIHTVALPLLAQKYGHAKATASLAKYGFSALGGFAASQLKTIPRPGNNWSFDWQQPNLLDNPVSTMQAKSDPELFEVLTEGWNEGRDSNIITDTFAQDIGNFGKFDPEHRSMMQELMKGRVDRAAWRGTKFAFNAMGTLMHQMERVNREATYMAVLELAYRERRKKGMPHEQAKTEAIEEAMDLTLEATFDFSAYNKPRILTTKVGRVAGQFYSFPYLLSSIVIRNGYTAIRRSKMPWRERVAAIEVFTAININLMLYAGVMGFPVTKILFGMASMLAWLFDGEDEEEGGGLSYIDEEGNLKWTYNVGWWFQNVLIPKFFGKDGAAQTLLGYDDVTAELAQLSAQKGPISALTDVDLANSVALDFMFFVPEAPRAETPEGAVAETAFNFFGGATAGVVMDYVRAGYDLARGEAGRAAEKLPKLVGNVVKAMRFAEEGQRTYSGNMVGMPEEFWTNDKLILQSLGAASTEANVRLQRNYGAIEINQQVARAKETAMDKFRRAVGNIVITGPTEENRATYVAAIEARNEYNRRYPFDPISNDTLYESQIGVYERILESEAFGGLPFSREGKTPYLNEALIRQMESEAREE